MKVLSWLLSYQLGSVHSKKWHLLLFLVTIERWRHTHTSCKAYQHLNVFNTHFWAPSLDWRGRRSWDLKGKWSWCQQSSAFSSILFCSCECVLLCSFILLRSTLYFTGRLYSLHSVSGLFNFKKHKRAKVILMNFSIEKRIVESFPQSMVFFNKRVFHTITRIC